MRIRQPTMQYLNLYDSSSKRLCGNSLLLELHGPAAGWNEKNVGRCAPSRLVLLTWSTDLCNNLQNNFILFKGGKSIGFNCFFFRKNLEIISIANLLLNRRRIWIYSSNPYSKQPLCLSVVLTNERHSGSLPSLPSLYFAGNLEESCIAYKELSQIHSPCIPMRIFFFVLA